MRGNGCGNIFETSGWTAGRERTWCGMYSGTGGVGTGGSICSAQNRATERESVLRYIAKPVGVRKLGHQARQLYLQACACACVCVFFFSCVRLICHCFVKEKTAVNSYSLYMYAQGISFDCASFFFLSPASMPFSLFAVTSTRYSLWIRRG